MQPTSWTILILKPKKLTRSKKSLNLNSLPTKNILNIYKTILINKYWSKWKKSSISSANRQFRKNNTKNIKRSIELKNKRIKKKRKEKKKNRVHKKSHKIPQGKKSREK